MKRDDRSEVFRPARHKHVDEDDVDAFDGGDDLGEDLRYEGPISLDDEGAERSEGAGGKVFLTAAILGAAVILILGVALVLRRDGAPAAPATSAATRPAPLRGPTAPGTMPGDPVRVTPSGEALPRGGVAESADTGANTARATGTAPAFPAPSIPFAAPSEARREAPASGDEILEGDSPPPIEAARADEGAFDSPREADASRAPVRPEPVPAREVAPSAPAPAARPASATSGEAAAKRPAPGPARASYPSVERGADLHALVASGRLGDAARAGQARASRGGWALQLMLACDAQNLKRAFAAVPSDDLFVVPAKGREGCFKVLWGHYDDRDAAAAARPRVPAHFSNAGTPVPVALSEVAGS